MSLASRNGASVKESTNPLAPGIDVVRNRIKGFAQKKVTLPQGRHKLVILDEADRYADDIPPIALTFSERDSLDQHDIRGATSPPTHDGDLLVHHPLRLRLQRLPKNHRTAPIPLRDSALLPPHRHGDRHAPPASLQGRIGAILGRWHRGSRLQRRGRHAPSDQQPAKHSGGIRPRERRERVPRGR